MEKIAPYIILILIFVSALSSVLFACAFGSGNSFFPKLGLDNRIELLG